MLKTLMSFQRQATSVLRPQPNPISAPALHFQGAGDSEATGLSADTWTPSSENAKAQFDTLIRGLWDKLYGDNYKQKAEPDVAKQEVLLQSLVGLHEKNPEYGMNHDRTLYFLEQLALVQAAQSKTTEALAGLNKLLSAQEQGPVVAQFPRLADPTPTRIKLAKLYLQTNAPLQAKALLDKNMQELEPEWTRLNGTVAKYRASERYYNDVRLNLAQTQELLADDAKQKQNGEAANTLYQAAYGHYDALGQSQSQLQLELLDKWIPLPSVQADPDLRRTLQKDRFYLQWGLVGKELKSVISDGFEAKHCPIYLQLANDALALALDYDKNSSTPNESFHLYSNVMDLSDELKKESQRLGVFQYLTPALRNYLSALEGIAPQITYPSDKVQADRAVVKARTALEAQLVKDAAPNAESTSEPTA